MNKNSMIDKRKIIVSLLIIIAISFFNNISNADDKKVGDIIKKINKSRSKPTHTARYKLAQDINETKEIVSIMNRKLSNNEEINDEYNLLDRSFP